MANVNEVLAKANAISGSIERWLRIRAVVARHEIRQLGYLNSDEWHCHVVLEDAGQRITKAILDELDAMIAEREAELTTLIPAPTHDGGLTDFSSTT